MKVCALIVMVNHFFMERKAVPPFPSYNNVELICYDQQHTLYFYLVGIISDELFCVLKVLKRQI